MERKCTRWPIDINDEQIRLEATREMIDRFAVGFNDALTWVIDKHADEIFQKLRGFFVLEFEKGAKS